MSWPPVLRELKVDLGLPSGDTVDDTALAAQLAAAVAFVEEVHDGRYDFAGDDDTLPAPGSTIELGAIRLAGRWFTRRRSPDGLVVSTEFGSTRIPSFDPDIERLLRIGRYSPPVIA
jgi:hypothetical protein